MADTVTTNQITSTSKIGGEYEELPIFVANSRLRAMMDDEDVRALGTETRHCLFKIGLSVLGHLPGKMNCRIAVFGDLDDGTGELVVRNDKNMREMRVTALPNGTADFCLVFEDMTLKRAKMGDLNALPLLASYLSQ